MITGMIFNWWMPLPKSFTSLLLGTKPNALRQLPNSSTRTVPRPASKPASSPSRAPSVKMCTGGSPKYTLLGVLPLDAEKSLRSPLTRAQPIWPPLSRSAPSLSIQAPRSSRRAGRKRSSACFSCFCLPSARCVLCSGFL